MQKGERRDGFLAMRLEGRLYYTFMDPLVRRSGKGIIFGRVLTRICQVGMDGRWACISGDTGEHCLNRLIIVALNISHTRICGLAPSTLQKR